MKSGNKFEVKEVNIMWFKSLFEFMSKLHTNEIDNNCNAIISSSTEELTEPYLICFQTAIEKYHCPDISELMLNGFDKSINDNKLAIIKKFMDIAKIKEITLSNFKFELKILRDLKAAAKIKNISLCIKKCNIASETGEYLADYLAFPAYDPTMASYLSLKQYYDHAISKNSLNRIELNLSKTNLTDKDPRFIHLIKLINNGELPNGTKIDLSCNKLNDNAMMMLMRAINKNNNPCDWQINLEGNYLISLKMKIRLVDMLINNPAISKLLCKTRTNTFLETFEMIRNMLCSSRNALLAKYNDHNEVKLIKTFGYDDALHFLTPYLTPGNKHFNGLFDHKMPGPVLFTIGEILRDTANQSDMFKIDGVSELFLQDLAGLATLKATLIKLKNYANQIINANQDTLRMSLK